MRTLICIKVVLFKFYFDVLGLNSYLIDIKLGYKVLDTENIFT